MIGSKLSEKTFRQGIERLEAAFRTLPLSKPSLKIYYEKLQHLEDKSFIAAVEQIIEKETFFPAISRFCISPEEEYQDKIAEENLLAVRKQIKEFGYNPDEQ